MEVWELVVGCLRSSNYEIGIDPLRREQEFGSLTGRRALTEHPRDARRATNWCRALKNYNILG